MITHSSLDSAVIGKDDPGYARVQQLVTNESEFSKDWVSSVTEGCAAVAPLLPDDVDRDAHNMFLICCRINSNAHGLCVDARNNSMALGLLPTCSMINHSCAPNSSFSSDYTAAGPRVTVRAVKVRSPCITRIEPDQIGAGLNG